MGDDDDDGPVVFKRNITSSKNHQLKSALMNASSHRHDGASSRHATNNGDADDEDDGPLVFRRNNTSSKEKLLNSAAMKSPPHKHDASSGKRVSDAIMKSPPHKHDTSSGKHASDAIMKSPPHKHDTSSGKHASDARASDRQNSESLKGKVVLSGKASTENRSVASPKTSTSTAQKSKNSSERNLVTGIMEKKPLNAPADSGTDSDDDKPLSARVSSFTVTVKKSDASHVSKEHIISEKGVSSIKKSCDDSEDEKPLSSKFSSKSGGAGASVKSSHDSDDDKPLSLKLKQNGSGKGDPNCKQPSKSSILNKRPSSDVRSPPPSSSVKKPKLLAGSVPNKIKVENEVKKEAKMDVPNKIKVEKEVKKEAKMDDDDDHIPISQRMKKSVSSDNRSSSKKPTKVVTSQLKKTNKKSKKITKASKYSKSLKVPPGSGGGQKWTTLEHNGVIFPPPYKPHGVKMLYNGQPVDLTPVQEEVATMFAVMKDTEYATKQKFIDNFMNDWKVLLGRNHVIKKFELCDFTPIYEWHEREKEKKKQMSTEEKKALKEDKLKQEEKYMWAVVDGVKEKVGNFRVEPPGLFRGRGEHPKMGKLKRRIRPSDITINIGKGAPIPECPIPGERWKEIKHDNTVTWLAFWNDPINPKEFKYVFLAASSSLKGQSDKEKYEKARMLKDYIDGIRATYTKDFVSKDLTKRQIAVATYLIDKLALRAGNEKDDDEADTVGCCTLKVENVTLVSPNKLQFDFLGKDSIRYFNTVEVELPVYKAIQQFQQGKKEGEDLFDKLDTSKLNAHLKELMPGLTAKVFRTYNASITLDDKLNKETKDGNVAEKIAVYQHANKEVAIICNHQRSVSKTHSAQMSRLGEKMDELKGVLESLKVDLSRAKKGKPPLKDADGKTKKNLAPEALEKKIAQTNAKIEKMELDMKIKEDLKTVALGTSKINYLDPRISVAWCKRHDVPIEKIFNKSLLAKFAWAMDVEPTFRF
eukprot:TRINITY_DN142_c0_g1_i2.p1 TRINITY_DN142_c0_g1~~TRINITY_DN142_c0_g1_i2.p1  ORF type:complete len:980 (+),score=266.07 TRINITY_DN142_c0_g1_i2:396-3335(+)